MDDGWRQLGRVIEAARNRRWRTRKEFARATGLSLRTINQLESGAQERYLPATLAAVELALGWQAGSCLRVVQGGKPALVTDARLERVAALWPHLTADAQDAIVRIVELAADGRW